MPGKAIVSGNELVVAVYKRYSRGMYILLGVAGFLAIFAAFVVYCLAVVHFSDFMFVIIAGVAAVLILASIGFIFNAGVFSAIRHYEPKIYQLLEEGDNLARVFDEYKNASNDGLARVARGYFELTLFIKQRSPALLEEFMVWREEEKARKAATEAKKD